MTIALSSDTLSTAQIYDAADTILAQRLSQAEGVSQVQVNGAEKPAVRVRLDPQRLAAAGVAAQDVYNAIRGTNVLEPTGGFEGPDRAETIGVNGQLSQAAEYAPLVIKAGNGAVLRLSDVATVIDGTANTRLAAWNGKTPAILLSISKEAGANVIDTVDRIRELLPQLMEWLPPDIKLTVIADRTTTIRASVADVQYTLGITIVLVLLVVLLFMRRLVPTVAAAVTVPLSICGTLAGMWFLGYTIDNFSLMALTISVGFVVDDAIVMIENIVRHMEKGDAAVAGGADRRAADRLHRDVDQHFPGRRLHPADLHGRHPRAAVPRIRHDDDAGDRHLRGGIAVADADAVRPLYAGAGTRRSGRSGAALDRGDGSRLPRQPALLRAHARLGAAAPRVHAAGDRAHRRADGAALHVGAERVHAVAGHRHPGGLDAGLARHLLHRDGGSPARRGGRGAGRSGGGDGVELDRRRLRLVLDEPRLDDARA